MATKYEAPYQQSRSALRRLYGSRSINASAPQSAMDDTPSGRQRALRDSGLTRREVAAEENDRWRTLFPAPDMAPVNRPLAMLSARRPPTSTLESIQQAQANGAAYGNFPVPQYGGSVGFRNPSLMPAMDADVSDIAGLGGGVGMSPLSFFKQRPRPSILSGAQNWIAPV